MEWRFSAVKPLGLLQEIFISWGRLKWMKLLLTHRLDWLDWTRRRQPICKVGHTSQSLENPKSADGIKPGSEAFIHMDSLASLVLQAVPHHSVFLCWALPHQAVSTQEAHVHMVTVRPPSPCQSHLELTNGFKNSKRRQKLGEIEKAS